ncbi:MAG: DUF2796 domain-containing protein [Steroidobacteraceae bacterium]|nr:DUF2796 domain-containing protein [Nevskiaceae bacterium]
MPRPSIVLSAVALGLVAAALHAQTVAPSPAAASDGGFVRHGAHLHGKIVVNLALEGRTLAVEFNAPAINVVGFERAARGAAEQRNVETVDRWLGSGVGMLGVPTNAGCERRQVEYTPPRLGAPEPAHDVGQDRDHNHGHEHEHDHEHHEHEAADGGHADYRARFTYDCANPAALAWADLWLLRRLKNVAEVEVNLVTPRIQTQRTLGVDSLRVELR